jgi:integrase
MARPATGSIREKKVNGGVNYELRFPVNGRRESVTLKSGDGWTRSAADAELEKVMAQVKLGQWRAPRAAAEIVQTDDPTFHVFASEWLTAVSPGLAPRTRDDYRVTLTNHLLPFFCDHRLTDITIREVDKYVAGKQNEGKLSASVINKTLVRLAQILERAVEYGLIAANPASGKRRKLKASAPRRNWLDPEQVKPLLDAVGRRERGGSFRGDPRTRALLATAICSGLRIGELLALRWRDVDLANRRLTVQESKTDAGRGRVVHVWPELRDELATYKASLKATPHPSMLVFGTSTGKLDTRQNVRKRLRRAVERANANLTLAGLALIPDALKLHDLRRTFAALLYERGESPPYVMAQLGHTDPGLALRIYTKVIGDRRDRPEGARLVSVVHGVEWSAPEAAARKDPALSLVG